MLLRASFYIALLASFISLNAYSSSIKVTGFARLLEEETFLSGAIITVDEFDWSGDLDEIPKKRESKTIVANENGEFYTTVKQGGWFRLSLKQGIPPDLEKAMADWLQHAVPSITNFSDEALAIIRVLNSDSEKLLHYIGMDSGLMLADRDYVGRNREMTFQVPLVITRNILNNLSYSTYGIKLDKNACQLVVTALSPRNLTHLEYWQKCPAMNYQPEVQNLFDCPHGASKVKFSTYPESQKAHYFGINKYCKTDVLATGLTETTRDGGSLLGNIYPEYPGQVSVLKSEQYGADLAERYFLCEPGRIVNISPPQGPSGLIVENSFEERGGSLSFYTVVGLLIFAYDLADNVLNGESETKKADTHWLRFRDEL